MPNFFLPEEASCAEKQFDAEEFQLPNDKVERVEGHVWIYSYDFDTTRGPEPGNLRVLRNYQNAATRIGGKVMWSDSFNTTVRIVKGGRETWAKLSTSSNRSDFKLTIVEKEQMKQDVVANAAALQNGLAQDGHVEVPGIFFDFGKSEVKPESEAALKEVAEFLKANAAVKVWVVGHTDNVGGAETNVTLSNARAAAVVKSLVAQGVGAQRLSPRGAGPFLPVATNKTEEGRARNRRVELVEQ